MSSSNWDDDGDDPFWARHPVITAILALVALIALGWGAYALKVALSPVKGAGDVIIQNQQATNRVEAQKKFEKLYAGILTLDQGIDSFAETARLYPNDRHARTNLESQVQACNNAVNEYNAASNMTLLKDWKRPDLPLEIDRTDPRTDCKGTEAR